MKHDDDLTALDQATANRLRRLSTMPVELGGLQPRIAREIPRPVTSRSRFVLGWRGGSAIAASLAVGVVAATIVIATSARPALATPEALADVYRHSDEMMNMDGMEGMKGTGKDGATVMACCIRKVGQQPLTCMTLDFGGKRVSMAIADAKHIAVPEEAQRKTVNGVEYFCQSSEKVNMVMAVRNGAWVCMMGEVNIDDLIQLLARTPVH